jgi:hypothetical protein
MDEYVCITVLSRPGEAQGEFAARLSRFWTQMLRQRKPDFEKVYAETTVFEECEGGWSRQYLAELDVVDLLEAEMKAAGVAFEPIDRDELYSKYEAVPPEWMQIEH